MNREQRRKANKKVNGVVADQIERQAFAQAIKANTIIHAMVLRDEFGFGEKRLKQFMDKVEYLTDSMDKSYLTLADMQQTLEDETGLLF